MHLYGLSLGRTLMTSIVDWIVKIPEYDDKLLLCSIDGRNRGSKQRHCVACASAGNGFELSFRRIVPIIVRNGFLTLTMPMHFASCIKTRYS